MSSADPLAQPPPATQNTAREQQEPEPLHSGGGLWDWLSDRLNPILVREVRQSLRGRYFRYTFWLTLVGALVIGLFVMANAPNVNTDSAGIDFFAAIFTCLCAAVHFFVPFAAFTAMGAEWDENTFDLLVASDLRPRHIVFGKLCAALVQTLLFFSAFVPFLAFSYVLRGVDLLSIGVAVGGALLFSLFLAAFAISLSSVARQRFARIALMAVLAVGLVYATGGAAVMGYGIVRMPHIMADPDFWIAVRVGLSIGLLLIAAFIISATGRLAHPEENRSTGQRILGLLVPLVGLGWGTYIYVHSGRRAQIIEMFVVMILLSLAMAATLAMSEHERLGRRARLQVPRSKPLAMLVTPLLPGGGRGTLWYLSVIILTLSGGLAIFAIDAPTRGMVGGFMSAGTTTTWNLAAQFQVFWTMGAYAFLYVALPTGLMARYTDTPGGQRVVRASVFGFAILALTLPSIWSFLWGASEPIVFNHVGNPTWVIDGIKRELPEATRWARLVDGVAILALILNLPRILRGVQEVLVASSDRREREAALKRLGDHDAPSQIAESGAGPAS